MSRPVKFHILYSHAFHFKKEQEKSFPTAFLMGRCMGLTDESGVPPGAMRQCSYSNSFSWKMRELTDESGVPPGAIRECSYYNSFSWKMRELTDESGVPPATMMRLEKNSVGCEFGLLLLLWQDIPARVSMDFIGKDL